MCVCVLGSCAEMIVCASTTSIVYRVHLINRLNKVKVVPRSKALMWASATSRTSTMALQECSTSFLLPSMYLREKERKHL